MASWAAPDYLDAASRRPPRSCSTRLVVDGRLRRVHMPARAPRTSGSSTTTPTSATACCASTTRPSTPRWLAAARELADRMVELFADPERGGFFYAGSDGEALVARTRELEDHPTPAGNSQAAHVLLRLADLTGDAGLEERAVGALRLVAADMARFPQAFGTALVALDHHLAERREIAVVGPRDDPRDRGPDPGRARGRAAPSTPSPPATRPTRRPPRPPRCWRSGRWWTVRPPPTCAGASPAWPR